MYTVVVVVVVVVVILYSVVGFSNSLIDCWRKTLDSKKTLEMVMSGSWCCFLKNDGLGF